MNVSRRSGVLVTGGSGYLGGLTAAALLTEDATEVILPVRAHHDADQILWHVGFGVSCLGQELTPSLRDRLHLVPLPPLDRMHEMDAALGDLRVAEVVHCAGCLDYFDKETLYAVNVRLTEQMLDLSRRWAVDRFTYVSTAYASGYIEGTAPEGPHPDPPSDPTDYTRTKREAERLVAGAGMPFQVVRPSIVIGTSGTGQYTGKRYGLYQMWNGLERLLCKKWVPVLHAVAPTRKASFVHQDSYQRGFLAARRHLPDAPFIHLASRNETSPTMREVLDLWIHACARPREVVYYERVEDVPMREIDSRQRAFLSLAWTNLQIASRHWRFATDNLDLLRERGAEIPEATLASIETCQRVFIESSEAVQRFIQLYHRDAAEAPRPL